MSLFACLILDALLIAFFFGGNILDLIQPRGARLRRHLREACRQLKAARRRNLDLLSQEQMARAEKAEADLQELAAKSNDAKDEALAKLEERAATFTRQGEEATTPRRGDRILKGGFANMTETLVVSVAVAFGIRALFVQPFKIPTGSMQPTLYGIHFTANVPENGRMPGRLRRLFDYVNYSRRYVHLEVSQESGPILVDWLQARALPAAPLFPKSAIPVRSADGTQQTTALVVPAAVYDVQRLFAQMLNEAEDTGVHRVVVGGQALYQPGETIVSGAMESGDHLFVNRLSLCFRAPKRGDMMVFSTNGLAYRGKPLSGDFYIKRLVGLPGDTLKLVDGRLWFRPKGESDFRLADEQVHPAFGKINSCENGYSGYSALASAACLRTSGEEYTVPDECYFMLGDNTNNSLDSRFWGPVPRRNLIGRPCFVWWPFSKRFGLT